MRTINFFVVVGINERGQIIPRIPFLFLVGVIMLCGNFGTVSRNMRVILLTSMSNVASECIEMSTMGKVRVVRVRKVNKNVANALVSNVIRGRLSINASLKVVSKFRLSIPRIILFRTRRDDIVIYL